MKETYIAYQGAERVATAQEDSDQITFLRRGIPAKDVDIITQGMAYLRARRAEQPCVLEGVFLSNGYFIKTAMKP